MGVLNENLTPDICFADLWRTEITPNNRPWAKGLCAAIEGFMERNAMGWHEFILKLNGHSFYNKSYPDFETKEFSIRMMKQLATFCASFTAQHLIGIGPVACTIVRKDMKVLYRPAIQIFIDDDSSLVGTRSSVVVDVKAIDLLVDINKWAQDNGVPRLEYPLYPIKSVTTFEL